jgi:hypothetical protein
MSPEIHVRAEAMQSVYLYLPKGKISKIQKLGRKEVIMRGSSTVL